MSNTEERLFIAKHELCESLGDITMMVYLSHLKMWFRKLWSKEQFDFECRQILTSEQQHLHNEFFLAILNKITLPLFPESANKTVTAKKRKRRTGSERSVFEPVELFDYLPEEGDDLPSSSASPHQPRFAADELFLPDTSLIMGRLLVIAWENGLSGVDDNTCEIMVQAVQVNIYNNEWTAMTFFNAFDSIVFRHCWKTSSQPSSKHARTFARRIVDASSMISAARMRVQPHGTQFAEKLQTIFRSKLMMTSHRLQSLTLIHFHSSRLAAKMSINCRCEIYQSQSENCTWHCRTKTSSRVIRCMPATSNASLNYWIRWRRMHCENSYLNIIK